MASYVKKKELKLGAGLRYPVFVGSGAVIFSGNISTTDPEFQIVLHATATATQMVGHKVVNLDPKATVHYDNKTNRVLTYYSYPQPSITTEKCIDIIKRLKALPYPEHMMDRTKQRNIILNYDFNTGNISPYCLRKLAKEPNLFYAIELACTKLPNNINNINKEIQSIKKTIPNTKVWLKLPHPTDIQNTTHLKEITTPDAIVFGFGHPAVKETTEEFDPMKPTLESGTHLYRSTCATVLSCKDNMRVPMIASGGIYTDNDIIDLLHYGASGVQVTSLICKNWISAISIYKKLRKSYK